MVRLHRTADVHLGAKFLGLGDKGAAQRGRIRASFKKLISQAIVENVDIVLIAGDLLIARMVRQGYDRGVKPTIEADIARSSALLAPYKDKYEFLPGKKTNITGNG